MKLLSGILNFFMSLFKRKPTVPTSTGALINVAFVNESTVLSDDQIKPIVAALQIQVNRDFAPLYGTSANLIQVLKGGSAPKGAWIIAFLDDSDQAGALGYHDVGA